jgi:hypothetical protein
LFPVLGQEGDGDPMHSEVLADFSRCLHVRKTMNVPPSDLGNEPRPFHTLTREPGAHCTLAGRGHNVEELRGRPLLMNDIVSQYAQVEKAKTSS